jgi:hypothetical protein
VHHHTGLGDHFICNGLVHALSDTYDIDLICKTRYLKTVKHLYEDFPDIHIIGVEDDHSDTLTYAQQTNYPLIRVGFENCDYNRFEDSFYETTNIDPMAEYDRFVFPKNLEGSKILYWNEELNTEEYIPIEKLRKGMKVKTALDGYIAIEVIGKSILQNSVKHKKNKDGLYKLSTISYPELFEDLYITGAHSILVDYLTEENRKDVIELLGDIFVTGNKYRLPICLDDKSEPYNEENQFIIWHLALENHDYYSNYGIYANGLLVESCSIRFLKELFQGELIE